MRGVGDFERLSIDDVFIREAAMNTAASLQPPDNNSFSGLSQHSDKEEAE